MKRTLFAKVRIPAKAGFFFTLLFFITGIIRSQNLNVTLSDQLSYGAQALANLWHWTDPQDGKEYALVAAANGMSIVDVSNPANVTQITQIPGPTCQWREIRTNGNYAYITTECGTAGLQIVNLINLPATNLQTATWNPTISGTVLETVHALQIDNGRIYLYGGNIGNGGAIIADIATNPMAPVYLGKYDPRYVHDGYVRNDTLYAGHIYDGELAIVDMSNPNNQTPMATFSTPNSFTHNSWLSENSKICFTTDEVNDSYLTAYDVSNMGNVTELDRIQSNPGSNSVVHNTYIIKKSGAEYAVTSWYKDGFTIVDVTRPANMVQVGNYDTAPATSGGGTVNNWGVDPYLPSGVILASDISNGLFVLNPTYVRACYLEGIFKDCSTGNPISGYKATIQLASAQSDAHIDVTDATGAYAVGVATPGTYQVIFTKSGSPTLSYNVSLSAGNVTVLNPSINCPPFTLTGRVFNTATSSGVPFASVRIQSGSNVWDTITNSSGNYSIPAFPSGTYEVIAGKWGFMTNCLQNQGLNTSTGLLSIGITAGIYDDFTWDWAWSIGGSAALGQWERGEPKGTTDGSVSANPNFDVGYDCSLEAYITGNTGSTGTDDDVDGGDTKLVSPYFNLTGYSNPYIYYSRWFYNGSGGNDTMKISIDNGTVSKVVELVSASTSGKGTWVSKSFKVSSYLAKTATMKLTVHTEDFAPNNIVETGFDQFYVLDSAVVSVNAVSFDDAEILVYPNPSAGMFNVKCLGVNGNSPLNISDPLLTIEVYNLVGEKMHSSVLSEEHSTVDLNDASNGLYIYKVVLGTQILGAGKLIIE